MYLEDVLDDFPDPLALILFKLQDLADLIDSQCGVIADPLEDVLVVWLRSLGVIVLVVIKDVRESLAVNPPVIDQYPSLSIEYMLRYRDVYILIEVGEI